jgi:lipoyl-dependent peroxiredoxin
MIRKGSAIWSGGLKDGKGTVSTESGAVKEQAYGFATRFESEPGTNPEELIGAAHAGCFSMKLAGVLGEEKMTAESIRTTAHVSLDKLEGGWKVTKIHLETRVKLASGDPAGFAAAAEKAKETCPISVLLKPGVALSLDAKLE